MKIQLLKSYFILFILCLMTIQSEAQRYLTPVFDEVISSNDITYGAAVNYLGENEELLLDFYEPMNDPLEQRPLVIYVHGGGFTDVNQSKSLVHIVAYCDSMARRGYAVSAINYRLDENISNRAVINAMHDAKAAIRFFRANAATYKIDPELIFIGGESAGAVTSITSTYINETDEVLYPPTTPLSSDLTVEGISGNPGFSSSTKGAMCMCGGTETIFGDLLFDTLAIQSPLDPPLLISHGTADEFIHVSKALELAIRANNIELPYLFYTFEGATHCPWFFPLDNSWQYLDTMITQTSTFLHSLIEFYTFVPEEDIVQTGRSVYPNPSADFVNVSHNGLSGKLEEVLLFDITGKNYKVSFEKGSESTIRLYIDQLAAGVYFGKMRFADGQIFRIAPIHKIIK